jgi:hypothetical protein
MDIRISKHANALYFFTAQIRLSKDYLTLSRSHRLNVHPGIHFSSLANAHRVARMVALIEWPAFLYAITIPDSRQYKGCLAQAPVISIICSDFNDIYGLAAYKEFPSLMYVKQPFITFM